MARKTKEELEIEKLQKEIASLSTSNVNKDITIKRLEKEILLLEGEQLNFCKPDEAAAHCFRQLKEHVPFERAQFVSRLSILVFKDQRDTVEKQRKELVYNENTLETLKSNCKLVGEGHLS